MAPESLETLKGELRSLGLYLKDSWIQQCINELRSHREINQDAKSFVFQQAIWNDLKIASETSIPNILNGTIQGPFIIQIEETLNISHHFEDRETSRGVNKILFSNGNRFLHGFEYKRINGLIGNTIGLKCLIQNVQIERGLLVLTPDNLIILGGNIPIEDVIVNENQDDSPQQPIQPNQPPQPVQPQLPTNNHRQPYSNTSSNNRNIPNNPLPNQQPQQPLPQVPIEQSVIPPAQPRLRPSQAAPVAHNYEDFVEASISDEEATMLDDYDEEEFTKETPPVLPKKKVENSDFKNQNSTILKSNKVVLVDSMAHMNSSTSHSQPSQPSSQSQNSSTSHPSPVLKLFTSPDPHVSISNSFRYPTNSTTSSSSSSLSSTSTSGTSSNIMSTSSSLASSPSSHTSIKQVTYPYPWDKISDIPLEIPPYPVSSSSIVVKSEEDNGKDDILSKIWRVKGISAGFKSFKLHKLKNSKLKRIMDLQLSIEDGSQDQREVTLDPLFAEKVLNIKALDLYNYKKNAKEKYDECMLKGSKAMQALEGIMTLKFAKPISSDSELPILSLISVEPPLKSEMHALISHIKRV